MTMRSRHTLLVLSIAGLLLGSSAFAIPGVAGASSRGGARNYLVVYKDGHYPSNAAKQVASAGGSMIVNYRAIGVVFARSSDTGFAAKMGRASGVQAAAATAGLATRLSDDVQSSDDAAAPEVPATDGDSLSGLQWDMVQMHTPEAHAISGGSPSITVGDIDTGLDYTHPDLAANVDFANSVSCVGGVPNTSPAAWNDDNGHGTHTAGTIAAASNGIGIVGVAPNVKIAGIKAGNAAGFFFPEAVICSFMWAATHHLAVTNNSYFADPWLFNCRNDPAQRAIWNAERRAIRYAQAQGTLVVAAEGKVLERKRFKLDRDFEDRPLPPVRAPQESAFCLQRLAALASLA